MARVTKHWPKKKISAFAEYIHNDSRSSISLFHYTRNITAMGVSYRY